MSLFVGSAVAIITPFGPDGVNTKEFGRLIDFQLASGTSAIVVCGTTGEPSTMSEGEKAQAIAFVAEHVAGRVPVIAGTGGNNTKKVVADSKKAKELGANALLVVTPYYNKCTQNGFVYHMHAVADATDLPIIMYNVPSRTGFNALPEAVVAAAEHVNIVAMKEASANIEQITTLASMAPGLDIYSGNDDHVLPLLSLGGKGVISVAANVCPRLMSDLVAAFMAGDIEKSRQLQFKVLPLVKALFCEVNPIPVKTACELMGYAVGELRLPLTPMESAHVQLLKSRMSELGII